MLNIFDILTIRYSGFTSAVANCAEASRCAYSANKSTAEVVVASCAEAFTAYCEAVKLLNKSVVSGLEKDEKQSFKNSKIVFVNALAQYRKACADGKQDAELKLFATSLVDSAKDLTILMCGNDSQLAKGLLFRNGGNNVDVANNIVRWFGDFARVKTNTTGFGAVSIAKSDSRIERRMFALLSGVDIDSNAETAEYTVGSAVWTCKKAADVKQGNDRILTELGALKLRTDKACADLKKSGNDKDTINAEIKKLKDGFKTNADCKQIEINSACRNFVCEVQAKCKKNAFSYLMSK